jgi:23S rRNA (cytidine1920-2'-O)/16S rRNA (cytidine1409-2'-O)-methyltransferase
LDVELVRRGLVPSRTAARDAVTEGLVTVGGRPATKPAALVAPDEPLHVGREARPFVSRGGLKLSAALDRFDVEVDGRECLDAGASTGGFTHALLEGGARHVVAVDVGYGQLVWELRSDPRVTVLERTNARNLTSEMLPYRPALVVADLSFISLTLVVPALVDVASDDATFVVLVKPQFEAGAGEVPRGGVVRDRRQWAEAISSVADSFAARSAGPIAVMASPVRGPAGNVEFLLHARAGADRSLTSGAVDAAIEDALALA